MLWQISTHSDIRYHRIVYERPNHSSSELLKGLVNHIQYMHFLGVLALMYLLALIASDYKLENIPQVQILLYWEGEGCF